MIFYRILPNLCLGVIEIRVGLCVGKFILKLMICKIFVCEEFLSPSVSALIQRVWAHHQQIQKKKKSLTFLMRNWFYTAALSNSGNGFKKRAHREYCGCISLWTLKCSLENYWSNIDRYPVFLKCFPNSLNLSASSGRP